MSVLDDVRAIAAEVSNWGRWGDKDQRGTLNLIDAAAIARGAGAVVEGTAFRLDLPADQGAPRIIGQPARRPPLRTPIQLNFAWTGDPATGQFNDDHLSMGVQAVTHWDALSHVAYDDLLFNGFPTSTVTVERGATRCGIDKVGVVSSRGVLLDLARTAGVDLLDHGTVISSELLDAAAESAGVEIEPGDIVLLRTGLMARWLARDADGYEHGSAGLAPEAARWFRRHDVAAYAVDTQNPDAFPPIDDTCFVPMHLLALRDLGMLQGQNWNLEALAEACAADGRHTCQLTATPLPITGASGAPVVPVALR